MNFTPTSIYLQKRMRRTSFDDIDVFRQLLMLEHLILRPLRGWVEESLFIGLQTRYPRECQILIAELGLDEISLSCPPLASLGRYSPELAKLVEGRRLESRERQWRERAEWITAGGQP